VSKVWWLFFHFWPGREARPDRICVMSSTKLQQLQYSNAYVSNLTAEWARKEPCRGQSAGCSQMPQPSRICKKAVTQGRMTK
jgi:hypothetical protein